MLSKNLLRLAMTGFICAGMLSFASAQQISDTASTYLYEYAKELYDKGDMQDAISQLQKALLANPSNQRARKFLESLSPGEQVELPAPVDDQELSRLKAEKLAMQNQYGQLKQGYLAKEGTLEKLTQDLQSSRELLSQKENALRAAIVDKENKIGFLNSEMAKLQQENSLYKQQLVGLKEEIFLKDKELKEVNRELNTRDGRSSAELMQKAEQLTMLKADYEKRLKDMESQVKSKELKIKALENYKQSFWEENKKSQSQQLARIEKLMRDIEEVVPEVKESVPSELSSRPLSSEDKAQQVKRIDKLMRQIKEVMPELQ